MVESQPSKLLVAGSIPVSRSRLRRSLASLTVIDRACLAETASEASAQRRLVAREGFEPSKALGRQIYSLLRLTASLPRRVLP